MAEAKGYKQNFPKMIHCSLNLHENKKMPNSRESDLKHSGDENTCHTHNELLSRLILGNNCLIRAPDGGQHVLARENTHHPSIFV